MSWCDFHWFSKTLVKHVSSYVLLPEVGEPPFAVFYLLHGLSDDHTIWMRHTRIESYCQTLPLIVVMPDGGRGFYTKNEQGPDYEDYLVNELPQVIERSFPARPDRASRCIGGLSMGGYGALRTALAHPDRYVSANSHSGAVLWGSREPDPTRGSEFTNEMKRIFGVNPVGSRHDLQSLVQKVPAAERPALRIDCGDEDHQLADNRALHAQLQQLGYDHEYAEFPGDHNWRYWDQHIRAALLFHARHLKLGVTELGE